MHDWQRAMGWAVRAIDPRAGRWPSFIGAAGREYTPQAEARALADAPPPRRTRADLMHAHGADFLRLAIHAAARLSRFAVFPVAPDDVVMGLQSPLARASDYAAWLRGEPDRLAGKTLADVANIKPPRRYTAHARADLKAARKHLSELEKMRNDDS
jgi:hypothetical protein